MKIAANRALVALTMLASLVVGCAPRTQVIVRVSADPEVREDPRYDHVRVTVRSEVDDPGAPPRLDEVVRPSGTERGPGLVPWPFDLVLAPEGGDAGRRYRVIVAAEDDGAPPRAFVTASAISGYMPNQTRVLHLRLTGVCRDVLCDDAGTGSTCRGGACERAEIAPGELPRIGEPPPDVSARDDGGPELDVGSDLDAGTPDARAPGLDAADATPTDAYDDAADAATPPSFDAITPFTSSASMALFGLAVALTGDGLRVLAASPGEGSVYAARAPTWEGTPAWTLGSPSAGLTVSVSDDGSWAAIGLSASSSVVMLVRSGDGWAQTEVLDATRLGYGSTSSFGKAVALDADGSLLAVGAPTAGTSVGGVQLFVRGARGWEPAASIPAPAGATAAEGFGQSVALSGDGRLLAVGAPGDDSLGMDHGAVYLYGLGDPSAPTGAVPIRPMSPESGEQFGFAVALDRAGTTLVVGAPYRDLRAVADAGRVLVYRGPGTWVFDREIVDDLPTGNEWFGQSVAIDAPGETLVIGAPGELTPPRGFASDRSMPSESLVGAAFVFSRDGTRLAFLKHDASGAGFAGLGWSVDISGNGQRVVAGAPYHGTDTSGAFFVFD